MLRFALSLVGIVWIMHYIVIKSMFFYFPSLGGRSLLLWITSGLTLGFATSIVLGRKLDSNFFMTMFNYWLGILFICLAVAVIMMLLGFALKIVNFKGIEYFGYAGAALAVLACVWAITAAHLPPAFKHITLQSDKLQTEKLTIVHLSDLHLGHGVRLHRVEKMVKKINALNPDLVLITGDLYEFGKEHKAKYSAVLKKLTPKYGVYGSMGNHEFYNNIDFSTNFYYDSGIKTLRQQFDEPLPGVQVLGIDDINTARISNKILETELAKLNPQKYGIVMSHEPSKLDIMAKGGAELVLCGHTHNGQIFPFNLFVKMRYPYNYGLYKIDKTNIYVTSGTFYWGPPMRLFTKNEVPVITVEKI